MAMHNIEESNSSLPEGFNVEESDLSVKQKHEASQLFTKWENVFLKSLLDIG